MSQDPLQKLKGYEMNTSDENRVDTAEENDSVSTTASEGCCGPGGGCRSASLGARARVAIGIVILGVAGVLVARAVIKSRSARTEPVEPAYTSVTAPADAAGPSDGSVSAEDKESTDTRAPFVAGASESRVAGSIAGREIAALSELNQIAGETDAVFVYLPAQKEETSEAPPIRSLEGAVRTIEAQGYKVGIFTLKSDAPEYMQLAAQMTGPGVVAMFKGRGMSTVTGDITETKLIQGFVAASGAGGCCPGGASECQ